VTYNVYRGTTTGGPYTQINGHPDENLGWIDRMTSTDQAGTTYFYVVAAVDDTGQASVYSNQVEVTVPSP
jgi:fibronectin type 3 domain-containing protein